MRALGNPSASTVASAMASGLTGSARLASAYQAANSRTGSSASVKSPPVNHVGCSIGAVSDIPWGTQVLAWGDWEASRRSQYSGPGAWRLCWRVRFAGAVAVVLCGLATGGCAYQLHSLLAKDDADGDQTGSITRPGDAASHTAAAAPDALARSGKDASVPWQNPNTGAGGNITPLASSYSEGGAPCRDFLASYAHGGAEDWLQGAACRTRQGNWEVKSLKPLKHT